MNDNIKGHTILVGKEPVNGRLLVSIDVNGQPKTTAIGLPGSVPNTVSRCVAQQGVAHFKIEISASGVMTITNLKPQNVTCVNGSEVERKVIKESSKITLGADRYPVSLTEILDAASKIINVVIPPESKEFSIRPLRKVWDDYHAAQLELKRKPQKNGQLQRLSSFFTIAGGSLYIALGRFGFHAGGPLVEGFFGTLTIIGIVLFAYSYYKNKKDDAIDEGEALTKAFQKEYVCPNPECHRYVGNLGGYDLLRQNKNCPYCKCRWTEG